MDEIITVLKQDLALQKKKLDDLKAWKESVILIEAQNAVISELEKKMETMREPTGK